MQGFHEVQDASSCAQERVKAEMSDELSLDARAVLRDLTSLLKSQERAMTALSAQKKSLRDDIQTMERRAVLAEANAASLETERQRLVERESALRGEVERLTQELAVKIDRLEAELSASTERLTQQANVAEERARALKQRCDELREKAEYGERMKLVDEKREAAEERAAMFEERCDALQAKADRHDRLDTAATKLLEELDRLPQSMNDAAIVPGVSRPEIPLYGTYDWQNVVKARLALVKEMRKERS
jgi:chromosome segregation ATPase